MAVVKIVPMPGPTGATGPAGSGNGISSTVPFNLNDTNENLLLSITKSGTGTTRITAPQDDLALRSARDIILYPGDDGPGKVYINWGDATISPNASNEVATLADIDETVSNAIGNLNLDNIKTRNWQYPTEGAIAIMPEIDNEAISLKSSDSAAIRWHVRNNNVSLGSNGILNPISAVVTPGDGNYQVVFTIPEQNSVPPTGNYYYLITCPSNEAYNASLYAQAATTTTLTFYYEADPGEFNSSGATIAPPSVYSQFEVDSNGAHVKLADWSSGPAGYSYNWNFQNDGSIEFPNLPSNGRTGNGEVLKFGNPTTQSIITGASPYYASPDAQRIVVAGQDGTAGDGYDGEGGDVYLWAGTGGGTNGNGGDIKLDGGDGQGTGQGGYVKMRGGDSQDGAGGFIAITAGDSYTQAGGDIDITAGASNNGEGTPGGDVNISAGYSSSSWAGGNINLTTSASGKITLTGAGGEFLNDSSNANNQIATVGDVASVVAGEVTFAVNGGSLGTQPTFDGEPLFSGSYVKTGLLVHFQIQVDMNNITSFGTGQYYVDLPFNAKYGYQFKEGCLHDISTSNQFAIGGHVAAGENRLFLTYTGSNGQDEMFDFNSPVTLNVADNFHISGTYISAS